MSRIGSAQQPDLSYDHDRWLDHGESLRRPRTHRAPLFIVLTEGTYHEERQLYPAPKTDRDPARAFCLSHRFAALESNRHYRWIGHWRHRVDDDALDGSLSKRD